jgi:hypothetical protein
MIKTDFFPEPQHAGCHFALIHRIRTQEQRHNEPFAKQINPFPLQNIIRGTTRAISQGFMQLRRRRGNSKKSARSQNTDC